MIGSVRAVASMSVLVLAAACGTQASEPESAAAPTSPARTTVDIAIEGGSIRPTGDRIEVEIGEPITLRVDSDAPDEIHVHSDPEHEFAVVPGSGQTFTFTVDVPGQVAVESHELGRTIVQLLAR